VSRVEGLGIGFRVEGFFQLEGFGTWHWSSSLIQPLEAYFVLSGAFCSSSIVYLFGHLLSIPDRHLHCSRFLYFMNKAVEMFWLVYHIAYG